jgi:hypothetical protein
VSQGRLAIEGMGAISDPERGWICDPLNPMFGTSLPAISQPNGRMGSKMALPPSVGSIHQGSDVRFLCCCPRVVPFTTSGIARGRFAHEGISLLMTDSPELL